MCEELSHYQKTLLFPLEACLLRFVSALPWRSSKSTEYESREYIPPVLSSGVSSADFSSNEISGGSINWDDDGTPASSMEDQFTFNTPVYLTPRDFLLSHPNPANILGWRGSYISSPVGPDPWGNKYFVNTVFSTVASDSAGGINEGQKSGGWSYDLFAISAGPNGVYETPFAQISAVPSGDDIIHIINGSTY